MSERGEAPPGGEAPGGDGSRTPGEGGDLRSGPTGLRELPWPRLVRSLAAEVAHEVRNPLAAILGYVEVAARENSSDPDEWIQGIRREVRRIDRVVEELSELGAPSRRLLSPVDVDRTVSRVCREVVREPKAPLRGMDLTLELDGGLPELVSDPAQLHCALEKVLLEAGETIPAGPDGRRRGRLTVTTGRVEGASPPAVEVVVAAHADGTSATPDAAAGTQEEPAAGRGLVLALTRQSVEKLGGGLEAGELPDAGTRFTVTLPVKGPGGAAGPARTDALEGAGGTSEARSSETTTDSNPHTPEEFRS